MNGIDLGYRIPFVIWFPPLYKHLSPWGSGNVSDELINFEDLAPTLISLSGGKVPQHMKGRVLLGKDRKSPAAKLFLSNDRSDNSPDMVRTVTDGRYLYSRNYLPFTPETRYTRYIEIADIKQTMREDLKAGRLNGLQKSIFLDRPAEFLFDLERDPWETKNLAGDAAFKNLLEQMQILLNDNILASRDVMFLPEYEIGLISATTTPYDYRLDDAKYPLKEIVAAASVSGKRSKEVAKQQVKLLQSENRVIRYWAITGLRSQNAKVLAPYENALLKAMKDAYPPVAITASAINYDLFGNREAEMNLKKYSKEANNHLALMTINYLLYVSKPEPFTETIKQILDQKGLTYEISAASKDFLGKLGLLPNNFEHR